MIENLALRQQVTALKKERPRPPLEDVDRAFWVALRESWPRWASRLVIVTGYFRNQVLVRPPLPFERWYQLLAYGSRGPPS